MKKILLGICTLIISLAPLSGEEALKVDLDTAISMARSNNIDLKIATLKLAGKRRGKNTAYNVFYPTLKGTSTVSRSNTAPSPLEVADNVYYTPDRMNLSLGYEASFNFTPALFNAITLLKRDYELGEITYDQAVTEMENSVKDVFYNIILLREQASLLQDNLKTIESRYNLTKLNYDAGLVSELELLKVKVNLENFKPELSNVRNSYSATIMNFKNLLGIDLEQAIDIDGEINPEVTEITVDEAYEMAMRNNMDLKKVYKSEEVFKAQKTAKFSQNFLPVINVQYSSGTILNDPFGNDRLKQENFTDDNGMFALSLVYSFDALLPNSKQRMEIETIERSIADIGYQRSALLDGIRLQITNHINSLNNSLNIQKGLELTVDLAEKTLGKIQEAYKAGTADLLEVENQENEYKKARLELLREKYNYNSTLMKLETIISGK